MMTLTGMLYVSVSGWISVSVSEFHTVEVQSGEEVTLMCTNFTSSTSHIFWFRLDNRPNATCISSMSSSDASVTFCDGFQNGKFNMTSNITTLFLQIKQADSSDSGLYFCGSYWNNWSIIVSATYLKVQGKTSVNVILGAVTLSLIIAATGIAVTFKLFNMKNKSKNLDSGDLKDAALSLCSKTIRSRRPASVREVESHVMYAASK
uniref:Ig-like domain-containing protein n=1 Tax=Seriola lalandi dorsalis TaxID=1841481 RepID=A0A3B4XUD6_SERLL